MKKNRYYIYVISLIVFLIVPDFNKSFFSHFYKYDTYAKEMMVLDDRRACWVSFLDIEEYLCDLDETAYRLKLCDMYDNMLANNLNTVIFHVRPMGDAIYPSRLFPWSVYISSKRIEPLYNPLQIAIEEAHRKGISFEAWINPYRLSKNDETTESFKTTAFYVYYKDIIIEYKNIDGETCLSLDPSREESKAVICDGITEIVSNYDVDGIHFDDYFYVTGMEEGLSVEEKTANVNYMITSVYKTIKSIKPDCQFGISPAGNMENAKEDGADIEGWLSKEGYIDYIMPQLYWSDDFITSEGERIKLYSQRCEQWQNLNKLNKPIYAGLALYKVGEEYAGDTGWSTCDDNLKNQCEKAYQTGYSGYALFRYAWLENENSSYELDNLNSYMESLIITDTKPETNNLCNNSKNNDNSTNLNGDMSGLICKSDIVSYNAYCIGITGKKTLVDGRITGINTLFKGIEAVEISLPGAAFTGGIEYRIHSRSGRWSDWVRDGTYAKDITGSYLIDGIMIRLYGDTLNRYDLFYRTGYFDDSFTEWKSDGEIAGDMGIKGAISCIELKIIEK